jgi:hypothetical protein
MHAECMSARAKMDRTRVITGIQSRNGYDCNAFNDYKVGVLCLAITWCFVDIEISPDL